MMMWQKLSTKWQNGTEFILFEADYETIKAKKLHEGASY